MKLLKSILRVIRIVVAMLAWSGLVTPVIGGQESSPLATNVAEGIQRLKPGQYLWAPTIAPTGPVLAVISLGAQRVYVYRNGVLIGVATVSTAEARSSNSNRRVHHLAETGPSQIESL